MEKLLWKYSIASIAKQNNVSDNGVRKLIKRYKLTTPPVGYYLMSKENKKRVLKEYGIKRKKYGIVL